MEDKKTNLEKLVQLMEEEGPELIPLFLSILEVYTTRLQGHEKLAEKEGENRPMAENEKWIQEAAKDPNVLKFTEYLNSTRHPARTLRIMLAILNGEGGNEDKWNNIV